MNQIIIAIIGSGALTALITNIFTMLKDRKDKSHGIAEGVQLLLYDRIKYLSKSYIKDGQISISWEKERDGMEKGFWSDEACLFRIE